MGEGERFPEMEYEAKDEELIRKYLIGGLSEVELRTVEERVMTDREFSKLATLVEDLLVEDYVEGRLRGSDHESFEKLFLATPEGAEQLSFTRALKEYAARTQASASSVTPTPGSRHLIFGVPRWAFAAAAIFLIAAVGVWRIFFFESDIDEGMRALNNAFRERAVEVRITGMQYAPRPHTTRGEADEKVDRLSLRQAEIKLSYAAEDNPGAESFHAFGRFYLARGNFDQAIEQFKKALELAPDDARILSDLGAAYLERGKAAERRQAGGGAEDFSRSLDHLNRAIDLDVNFLNARFNRALVYQQTSRVDQATQEWQEYLRRDSSSLWAGEARENIERLHSR